MILSPGYRMWSERQEYLDGYDAEFSQKPKFLTGAPDMHSFIEALKVYNLMEEREEERAMTEEWGGLT